MSNSAEPFKKSPGPAGERRRSEGVTLTLAVLVAVGLGVAVGIWINARLTPNSSAGALPSSRALPEALVSNTHAPAAQPSPCDGCANPPASEETAAGEESPARVPANKSEKAETEADTGAPVLVERAAAPSAPVEPSHPAAVADGGVEADGATDSGAVASASPDPSRPMAWEVGARPRPGARAAARANVERGTAQSGESEAGSGAQSRPVPCSLYTSANSLSVRVGGATPLILGGPGVGVRINVTTPDWSTLAVIFEGPAGSNGWLRYSVRSISRRPGLYTVHVSSPCGSQTIPVTIK